MSMQVLDAQIPRETDTATGLPIGPCVADASPGARPQRVVLDGRFCRLEPLDPARHGDDLYRASLPADASARFLYLFEEPPTNRAEFQAWLERVAVSTDPLFFAVIDKRTGKCEGRQTLMRIDPTHRVIETGSIYWGPAISRSPVTTEANFLFAKYVFDTLGYRRFEWKCNALNAPSRVAAERFGFTYEGHFRRAVIIKGRTRDTSWYSMIAEDWPQIRAAYERWLAPENFDAHGHQKLKLRALVDPELSFDGVQFRRATEADLANIVVLQRSAYAPNRDILGVEPSPLMADYSQVLATMEVWCLDVGAQIGAVLILEPHFDHLLIWNISTDPMLQGRGLGRQLLGAAEVRANCLGVSRLRLYTGTKLVDRIAWYSRHGYAIESTEQLSDRSRTNMIKILGA